MPTHLVLLNRLAPSGPHPLQVTDPQVVLPEGALDMDSGGALTASDPSSNIVNPALRNALWQAFACSR
jgi:hypothetical protein